MTNKQWIIAGVGIVAVALIVFGWTRYAKAPVPSSTPDLTTTSTTSSDTGVPNAGTTTPSAVSQPFPINAADSIASWNFKGAYAGNDILIKQANADIAKLTGLIGKGKYDDYDLYNGIANDYGFLGDGKTSYQNYNRAIHIHQKKGLAYANLGHLMDELGAYHTATDAYAKAVAVEPGMLEYHLERLTYLTRRFGSDDSIITSAFADASKQFGDAAPVLKIEAEWLADQKRYVDAIKVLETVKTLLSGTDTSAIDAEIARLKAKQ